MDWVRSKLVNLNEETQYNDSRFEYLPVCRSAGGGVNTSEKKATFNKSIGSLIGKIRSANAASTVESIPPENRMANFACWQPFVGRRISFVNRLHWRHNEGKFIIRRWTAVCNWLRNVVEIFWKIELDSNSVKRISGGSRERTSIEGFRYEIASILMVSSGWIIVNLWRIFESSSV
jgi:hypothetical protein